MRSPNLPNGSCPAGIYVVDDNADICMLIGALLSTGTHRVQTFETAEVALEALHADEVKPFLLITDYEMPGMNGMELIQKCKELHPRLKTISISGSLTPAARERYAMQPDRLVPKPFNPRDLIAAIEEIHRLHAAESVGA